MAEKFTSQVHSILSAHIPNKIVECNDKDPPWMTNKLKTAIKRKHRVFDKYIRPGKKQVDWDIVKVVRNATCKMVGSAKEKYLMNLGWKLADRDHGPKTYLTVLNRLINKKKVINIPPLLEDGVFVTSIQTKTTIFNDFFVQQCATISTGSTIPAFLPLCDNTLCDILVDRVKVLSFIGSLDNNKAHGWDGILAHIIKLCDSSIVEPLCIIFDKCLFKQAFIIQSGKQLTLSLFIRKEIDRVRKTIDQYRCCQFLVKSLRRLFLMLCTSTFVTTTF